MLVVGNETKLDLKFFDKYKRIIFPITLSIVFLGTIIFVSLGNSLSGLIVEDDEKFDSKTWNLDYEKRIFMLNDLEQNYLKIGQSRIYINKMLGDSDSNFATEPNELGYDLGIDFLDPCAFIIKFDSTQHVISWQKKCS